MLQIDSTDAFTALCLICQIRFYSAAFLFQCRSLPPSVSAVSHLSHGSLCRCCAGLGTKEVKLRRWQEVHTNFCQKALMVLVSTKVDAIPPT